MALPTTDRSVPHTHHDAIDSTRVVHRTQLIAQLAERLVQERAPRLHLLVIMVIAGGAAFLSSVLFLWSDITILDRMSVRYAAAALCGYLAFVALIRLWIALHRPGSTDALDITHDAADFAFDTGRGVVRTAFESRTADGREAQKWLIERESVLESDGGSSIGSGWSLDLDFDGFVWLAIAAACTVAGVLAVAYVIYIAPVLLAEVALDAAIVSALYRRLRRDETAYWLTTVFTRTWVPALVLVVFAAGAGLALESIAPEARSIAGVFGSWRG